MNIDHLTGKPLCLAKVAGLVLTEAPGFGRP